MLKDSLREALLALPAGWSGTFLERVGSTQDVARAAARAGAPGRTIVVADVQTAGRGRQGRDWLAEPGGALLLSIVFRDFAGVPWRYTSLTSLALAESVEQVLPAVRVAIKWPNDLMLGDRKLAGVLAESTWDGERLVVIVGVGLNVQSAPESLGAVSLRAANPDETVDRGDVLHALLGRLDIWLDRPAEEANRAWQARLWGRGQRLRLADVGTETVVVLGVEADGSLRVRLPDGGERRTTTGELLP